MAGSSSPVPEVSVIFSGFRKERQKDLLTRSTGAKAMQPHSLKTVFRAM